MLYADLIRAFKLPWKLTLKNMTRIVNIKIDEKEPQVVEQMTADKYRGIILRYKFKNPVKFEGKMEAFKKKYEELGGKWIDIEKGILGNKVAEVDKLKKALKIAEDDVKETKTEAKEEPKKPKK